MRLGTLLLPKRKKTNLRYHTATVREAQEKMWLTLHTETIRTLQLKKAPRSSKFNTTCKLVKTQTLHASRVASYCSSIRFRTVTS
ncbi:unnamed protein product [Chondrus crispus]|uniref:Uncharacterized protein n=1 Tax=Chondrus crispus TaxID=2769 RepID=R7QAI9_CHOCR|nr:unnamed protein product [Chondrus crispus]CDF34818.1 unnamed protein product [Chondrus crispus]|eukprot:XP_005714637.1 unnamed protein product [Chondrus crispus]